LTDFFGGTGHRGPAVDSFFKDGSLVIRFDLPAVDLKDIDVSVAGNTLTVKASRGRCLSRMRIS
jgi:HSP20 family molecular chaperone IbpA